MLSQSHSKHGASSTETMRLLRDGEKGEGVWRLWKREIIYLGAIHCHHRNDCGMRWAATRAILMFHNCERQSHKTVSIDHNVTFEEKGEPKRYGTEVLPLTSLTPQLQLGQTGSPTPATSK